MIIQELFISLISFKTTIQMDLELINIKKNKEFLSKLITKI
jgi:hypothetical protein